jgi:hypothetical protein
MKTHSADHRQNPRKCSEFQLANFCFFYSWGVQAGERNKNKKKGGKPDNMENAAVIAHELKNAETPPTTLSSPPTTAPTTLTKWSSACETEVKVYCIQKLESLDLLEVVKISVTESSRECLDCVKEHIGRITAALKSHKPAFGDYSCSLRELGAMCNANMKGISGEETLRCEAQMKRLCGKHQLAGPECTKCIDTKLQLIDGGLVGDKMCSKYQLDKFCFAENSIKDKDAGIEKYLAERKKNNKAWQNSHMTNNPTQVAATAIDTTRTNEHAEDALAKQVVDDDNKTDRTPKANGGTSVAKTVIAEALTKGYSRQEISDELAEKPTALFRQTTPTSTLATKPTGLLIQAIPTSTPAPAVVLSLPPQPLDDPCHTDIKKSCSYDIQRTKECMQCVKSNVVKFKHCEPSDLLAVCDLTMVNKPRDATLLCVNQLETSCAGKISGGTTCMSCLKDHIGRIDNGLIDDNYCNAFQLEHFCYFYALDPAKPFEAGTKPKKAHEDALAKTDLEVAMERVGDADQNTFSCQLAFEQFCGKEVAQHFRCLKCLRRYEQELLRAGLHCTNGMFARFCLSGAVVESSWDKAADSANKGHPHSLAVLQDAATIDESIGVTTHGVIRGFRDLPPDEAGQTSAKQGTEQMPTKSAARENIVETDVAGSLEPASNGGLRQMPIVLLCILGCACFGARTQVLGALVRAWQGPQRGVKPGVWQYENEDEYGGGGYESDSGEPAGEGQYVERHRKGGGMSARALEPIVSRMRAKKGKTPLKV